MLTTVPASSRPDTLPASPVPPAPSILVGSMSTANSNVSPGSKSLKSMVRTSNPPLPLGFENGALHEPAPAPLPSVTRPVAAAPLIASKHLAPASPAVPTGSKTMFGNRAVLRLKVTLLICRPLVELLVMVKPPPNVLESMPEPGLMATTAAASGLDGILALNTSMPLMLGFSTTFRKSISRLSSMTVTGKLCTPALFQPYVAV